MSTMIAGRSNLRYGCFMSVKQQLAEAIDGLPESSTIEEAFERLYRAFKLKQMLAGGRPQEVMAPSQETYHWERLKERAERQTALAQQYPREFVVLVEEDVVFHSPERRAAEEAYQKALDRTDGKHPVLVSPDSRPPRGEPIFRGRSLTT